MVSRIELLTRLSGIFLVAGIAALCLAILMYAGFHLHDYLVLMQKARARYRSERPYAYRPEDNEAVPEKHTVQNPSDILRAEEKQTNEKAKEAVKGAANKDAKPKAEPAAAMQPAGKQEEKTETKAGTEPKPATPAAGAPAQAVQPEPAEEATEAAAESRPEAAAKPVREETASAKAEVRTPASPAAEATDRPLFRITRHVLITSGAVPASEKG